MINGISVPPMPANSTATVAGVDSNGNGVRDDVERALATRLGAKPSHYQLAYSLAKTIQSAISAPDSSSVSYASAKQYFTTMRCLKDADMEAGNIATQEVLDTRLRQRAMVLAIGGMLSDGTDSTSPSVSNVTEACQ